MKQKESVPHPVKPAKIKALVNRALKQGFKGKPAKGYKYLKQLNSGDRWITQSGMTGILIEITTNAKVIIQDVPEIRDSIWTKYEILGFLGTRVIGAETEVKEIGNVKDGLDTLSSK